MKKGRILALCASLICCLVLGGCETPDLTQTVIAYDCKVSYFDFEKGLTSEVVKTSSFKGTNTDSKVYSEIEFWTQMFGTFNINSFQVTITVPQNVYAVVGNLTINDLNNPSQHLMNDIIKHNVKRDTGNNSTTTDTLSWTFEPVEVKAEGVKPIIKISIGFLDEHDKTINPLEIKDKDAFSSYAFSIRNLKIENKSAHS